jgi:hypothetical protein
MPDDAPDIINLTGLSPRNAPFTTTTVEVASGATFHALVMDAATMHAARDVVYMHVHRASRRCYIGITIMEAGARWNAGVAYRQQRRFGAAIRKHGWAAFDSYILAFADDRDALSRAEVAAIAAAGGHKSKHTFNLSPGGDLVAENDKPLVGVRLETGDLRAFKSGTAAARELGWSDGDLASAVARGERVSAGGWWFRFADDSEAQPPVIWGDQLRVQAVQAVQARAVVAINYASGQVRQYPSTGAAARALGVHQSAVVVVASGEDRSAGDWWFRYADEDRQMPTVRGTDATRLIRDVPVYAVNLETGDRRQFRNCTVADEELGIYRGGTAMVAARERTSAAGWWFTYDPAESPPTAYKGALVALARSKPVIATDIAAGTEQTYPSAKAASEALGVSRAGISKAIKGELGAVKGYRFRFA